MRVRMELQNVAQEHNVYSDVGRLSVRDQLQSFDAPVTAEGHVSQTEKDSVARAQYLELMVLSCLGASMRGRSEGSSEKRRMR